MELDRQSIEKRDFPIGRRGYDPAAVDAHLRSIAAEVEELRYSLESRAGETLGSSAGTQVQGILEAAEATAADIEQKAAEDARATREQAAADAAATRADAIARAQAHVSAVARATGVLIERVESIDSQSAALVASLRDGTSRLATDLTAVETNMAELYDAASGRAGESPAQSPPASSAPVGEPTSTLAPAAEPGTGLGAAEAEVPVRQGHAEFVPAAPAAPAPEPNEGNGDLDGARLIALNMALNGDSRAATDRYLAEHYELADRQKLLDEVFAAIEG
jgi:DivIVA domain-containing protein